MAATCEVCGGPATRKVVHEPCKYCGGLDCGDTGCTWYYCDDHDEGFEPGDFLPLEEDED
jgi:hypothetical protein